MLTVVGVAIAWPRGYKRLFEEGQAQHGSHPRERDFSTPAKAVVTI